MVLAKSKNTVGLGNSLMHDRFGHGKGADRKRGNAVVRRAGPNGEAYITNEASQAGWVKMRSITEQAALDEFLTTAELAGTDFTAEKMDNMKIVHPNQRNPYLLSPDEERSVAIKHDANKERLTIPRRPPWNETMTNLELNDSEKGSFLDWRRGLAELQESQDLLMTPFERNIEVWRQLWRVVERSDVVVQIVDARNPLLFRSEDLEKYVKEVDSRKENLLLVNKADMMTLRQRQAWAQCFHELGISYRYFSASPSVLDHQMDASNKESEAGLLEKDGAGRQSKPPARTLPGETSEREDDSRQKKSSEDNIDDQRTRILAPEELEEVFLTYVPQVQVEDDHKKVTVGLVGYPNVGKSSTINTLIGAKKVSVSATPGKTKHFQTIHLSPSIILCDCPGLVFPNFASTRAELVCNGILPIDQLREFTGPVALVCERIPQAFLESVYGIKIPIRSSEEGGTGIPTAEELLVAYAQARGFTKTGQGQPDESRAARYVLKDYVAGKLLFCHPPLYTNSIDPHDFNCEIYGILSPTSMFPRRPLISDAAEDGSLEQATESLSLDQSRSILAAPVQGEKSARLDKNFFASTRGHAGHLAMPFNYKYSEQGTVSSKQLVGRKQRALLALESGIDASELRAMSGKKHYKIRKGKMSGGSHESL